MSELIDQDGDKDSVPSVPKLANKENVRHPDDAAFISQLIRSKVIGFLVIAAAMIGGIKYF